MNGRLCWDGLCLHVPPEMDVATLDRGYIRLAGLDRTGIELRFGVSAHFDPAQEARRMERATDMKFGTISPCDASWCGDLAGTLYAAGRLFLFRTQDHSGIVAALFPAPPCEHLIRTVFASMTWTPHSAWRGWRCFDMQFETPPGFMLEKAIFQPGRFHVSFTKGRARLHLDRLAPAEVILGAHPLTHWAEHYLKEKHGHGLTLVHIDEGHVSFERRTSGAGILRAMLPGGASHVRGRIVCDRDRNKIMILTETGAVFPSPTLNRLLEAYATATEQN